MRRYGFLRLIVASFLLAGLVLFLPSCNRGETRQGETSRGETSRSATSRGEGSGPGDETSALVGKPAPEFSLEAVDGKQVKLPDFKGNVVLLDFWATWCPPCRKSLPHVQELSANQELAGKGLKVLAINAQEEKDTADEFVKKNGYSFTVPLDKDGTAAKQYEVRGIPTTVIIGRDGSVKKVFVGFDPDNSPKEIDEAVAAALKEEAPKKG